MRDKRSKLQIYFDVFSAILLEKQIMKLYLKLDFNTKAIPRMINY